MRLPALAGARARAERCSSSMRRAARHADQNAPPGVRSHGRKTRSPEGDRLLAPGCRTPLFIGCPLDPSENRMPRKVAAPVTDQRAARPLEGEALISCDGPAGRAPLEPAPDGAAPTPLGAVPTPPGATPTPLGVVPTPPGAGAFSVPTPPGAGAFPVPTPPGAGAFPVPTPPGAGTFPVPAPPGGGTRIVPGGVPGRALLAGDSPRITVGGCGAVLAAGTGGGPSVSASTPLLALVAAAKRHAVRKRDRVSMEPSPSRRPS